ncbi:MAG: efflux RND transporter periplasmic adaptor subunit [Deltaproteobacteria bacterium]|nr:efflux RND transporter periplasmic adaptor subunit [Deltaproteobacteria bacterium]
MARRFCYPALAAALCLALGTGCTGASPNARYRTQPVRRLTLEDKVVANGTVNPVTTVLVGSQVSGKIVEIYVDFNSRVRQGQKVAKIDPALFEAKVAEARATYQQAQAQVAKARANLADAEADYQRFQRLWQDNLVARDELDNAYTRYLAAKREAKANLAYTDIISPVDGVVIARNVDVGQTVAATFQTPTLFTIARDLTKMQVEVAVDEGEVGKVKEGQPATFTVDAYPDKVFHGRVTAVRLAPQTVQNVVTYTIIVAADNPELLLKPGMTATMSILVARAENVLAVPNAALRFLPPPEAALPPEGPVVWRVDRSGHLEPVPVSLGISDGVWTEVKEGRLQEGDRLAVGPAETQGTPPRRIRGLF